LTGKVGRKLSHNVNRVGGVRGRGVVSLVRGKRKKKKDAKYILAREENSQLDLQGAST